METKQIGAIVSQVSKSSNAAADEDIIKGKPWIRFPPLSPRRLSGLMVSTYESVQNIEKYWRQTNQNQTVKQQVCDEELETPLMKFEFPIGSEENLEALEHSLKADTNLRKALVEQLYLIGGKSWLQMVFHIMDFVISKDIRKSFTYDGKGSKCKPFKELLLARIIKVAVQKRFPATASTESATDKNIGGRIGRWLTNSKDRRLMMAKKTMKEPPIRMNKMNFFKMIMFSNIFVSIVTNSDNPSHMF